MKASPNNAATTRQGRGQRKSAPKSSGGRKPQEQAAVKRVRAQAAAPELSSGAAAAPRGSKQATVIALLRRPEGVTVAEIVAATGWQPHTVRGLFSGTLKRKLGLGLGSAQEDRGRVYRIVDAGESEAARAGS
jgi:hypothetical protein